MPIATSTPPLDLNSTVGCMLVGALFSVLFYGLTCAQVVYYSSAYYSSDKALVKAFVYGITLVEELHTRSYGVDEIDKGLVCLLDVNTGHGKTAWALVIESHANPPSLLGVPRTSHRVYPAEYVLAVLYPWALVTAHVVWINVQSTFGDHGAPDLPVSGGSRTRDLNHQKALLGFEVETVATQCGAALADLCICVSLCWTLRGARSGFKRQSRNSLDFMYCVKTLTFSWVPLSYILLKAHTTVYINSMMAV
ncbi:uncharacterized protein C8Q71DRAFT_721427 [Rhodofomes roseus]|uniref:Uncharacterized protein n=1 Tax=Rhodofomes roseus TaxID=34475 RepID=A0ABQ8KT41_9APHY|nr:uncharacterized protein C8Q71DRAFT_721427 [Rhodofomes roseus]KAH9841001.1 hypothetical protein C8Q71DRAFT_721427 [Rhodofomes roseus]